MPAKKATTGETTIVIRRIEDAAVTLEIAGLTPVMPHKWSAKALRAMPGHPEQDKMTKKGVREPEEEAEGCTYRLSDGRPGIPATAFKAAMVGACRLFDKPSMSEAKLLFYVQGEGPEQLVAIEGDRTLREDTPRNANGGADLRYRYSYFPWSATLTVRYVPTSIDAASVANLLDAAGRVGVGDWRPSAPRSFTGTFGQFRVRSEDDDGQTEGEGTS